MVDNPQQTTPEEDEARRALQFHYIKSNQYRVIYAEGAIGAVIPSEKIFFSFYNERIPIPDSMMFSVSKDGKLDKVIATEGKKGITREVEAGIVLDLRAAKALRDFLTKHIEELEKRLKIKQG